MKTINFQKTTVMTYFKEQKMKWDFTTKVKNACTLLAICMCILPLLTSCEKDEETQIFYNVEAEYFTVGEGNEAIATAIKDYQVRIGLLEKQFTLTIDKVDLTEEDYKELDTRAMKQFNEGLGKINYIKVLEDAGITVSPGRPDITIYYALQRVALNGSVIKEHPVEFILNFSK